MEVVGVGVEVAVVFVRVVVGVKEVGMEMV